MKKKIILGLAATGTALALLPLLAAFEAHVINVTATIENALSVTPNEIRFGTVFPEESFVQRLGIALSGSFLEEPRVDDVHYVIRQKPKCINEAGAAYGQVHEEVVGGPDGPTSTIFACDPGFKKLPLLCPYLSKHPDRDPDNDGSLDSMHGPTSTDAWTPTTTVAFQVPGLLAKSQNDTQDIWEIDILVPCFTGECAQDDVIPDGYTLDKSLEHQLFGCDLWVETTGISTPPPPQCSDGIDNDQDEKIDYPNDPGCSSPADNNETDIPA